MPWTRAVIWGELSPGRRTPAGRFAGAARKETREPSMEPLKICFVTSEVHPFSKTGGLADVSAALPAFLARDGHDVRIMTPLYGSIDRRKYAFQPPPPQLRDVPVRFGGKSYAFSLPT